MRSIAVDLLRKGLIYGLGSSLNGFVGFVLLPFVVHYLTSEEYGQYAIAEMIINLMLVFLGLGMNVALLARYPKLSEFDRPGFLSSVLSFLVLTTICIESMFMLVALAVGERLFPYLTFEDYALIAGISATETIWLFFATVFRAEGAAWKFIAISTVQVSLALVLSVALLTYAGLRQSALLYGRVLADIVVLMLLTPQLRRFRPTRALGPAIEFSRVGLPLVPATFASMWVVMSPRFFLERLADTNAVGSYTIESKLAGVVSLLFVQPFGMVWVAALARIALQPNAKQIYSRVITYYTLLGGTVALMVGLLGPFIARMLGKDEFPISPTIIAIIALANVASGLMYAVTIGPYVRERTGTIIPVFMGSMLLSVGLGWALTSSSGIVGAALALLVVYTLQALMLGYVSNELYPVPIEWSRLIRGLAVLVAAYMATRHVVGADIPWWSPAVLLVFVAVGGVATRVVTVTDLRSLRAAQASEQAKPLPTHTAES